MEHLGSYCLFHAAAVSHDGEGVILPAAPQSGKTTLTAALVGAGLRYFSDEMAVLDPSSLRLLPYARSLNVRNGSLAVLKPIFPQLHITSPRLRIDGDVVWYLQPHAEWLPEASAPVRYVILPEYIPGAPTEMAPIDRSLALKRFLEQSFNLRGHGARGVGAVVRMLEGTRCFSLTYGNLGEAVTAILQALASTRTSATTRAQADGASRQSPAGQVESLREMAPTS